MEFDFNWFEVLGADSNGIAILNKNAHLYR